MSFVIETDIPVPASRSKYPFADMEVGNSVLFPLDAAAAISAAAMHAGKKLGRRFIARTVDDGYRVWRVE